jgi:hypothetical protein
MSSSSAATREAQAHATLRNLQNKKPVPEIDFTIHTMDDGTTASTLERYSKGIQASYLSQSISCPLSLFRSTQRTTYACSRTFL